MYSLFHQRMNEHLKDIDVYEAGKPIELVVREFGVDPKDIVKLASNENPLGTSPKVAKVICEHANRAHMYPDDSMYALKEALSKKFLVEHENLIIGAGSDQVLSFISHLLLNSSKSILTSRVSFAMYDIYAAHHGAKVIKTPSYQHKADEFIPLIKKHSPSIVYLCTPNNPTGDAMDIDEVYKIIEATDSSTTLVVIDGAYMEYAQAKSNRYKIEPSKIIKKYPNVLYLGTFSKAYGLGGMRVGYGIAREDFIKALLKVRPPFNITTLSMAAAVEALNDTEFVEKTLLIHSQEISRYEEFAKEHNIKYIPSATNFITYLFEGERESDRLYEYMLKRGVIVRNLASYGMNALRITVGTKKQNERVFELLSKALN